MSWAAVIIGGGTVIGGYIASDGSKKASKASSKGSAKAIDEARRQYDQSRADLRPYREVGAGALNQLASLYGISQNQSPLGYDEWYLSNGISADSLDPTGRHVNSAERKALNDIAAQKSQAAYAEYVKNFKPDPTKAGSGTADFTSFFNTPDYKFNLSEGLNAVQNSAAARGGLYSGNALKSLQERGAGIASQQFGNYTNRLASLAGVGQTATNTGVQAGQNTAANIGNFYQQQGDARASGINGQANAWGSATGALTGYGYDYFSRRQRGGG